MGVAQRRLPLRYRCQSPPGGRRRACCTVSRFPDHDLGVTSAGECSLSALHSPSTTFVGSGAKFRSRGEDLPLTLMAARRLGRVSPLAGAGRCHLFRRLRCIGRELTLDRQALIGREQCSEPLRRRDMTLETTHGVDRLVEADRRCTATCFEEWGGSGSNRRRPDHESAFRTSRSDSRYGSALRSFSRLAARLDAMMSSNDATRMNRPSDTSSDVACEFQP